MTSTLLVRARTATPGSSRNGNETHERNLGRLAEHLARVPVEAALAERLAVIGRDHDQRVLAGIPSSAS